MSEKLAFVFYIEKQLTIKGVTNSFKKPEVIEVIPIHFQNRG